MTRAVATAHRRRAVILVGILVLIVAAAASDATHAAVRELLESVRAVIAHHPNAGLLLFVLSAALSGMLVFFSSAIIIPVAVYTWGKPLTIALLWVGWLIGGILSYLLGRYPGRRLFKRMIPAREIRHYEQMISDQTPFIAILLFQIALLAALGAAAILVSMVAFRLFRKRVAPSR